MTKCVICGTDPLQWDWTDFHGIGRCTTCGLTYDMKGFNGVVETKWDILKRLLVDE